VTALTLLALGACAAPLPPPEPAPPPPPPVRAAPPQPPAPLRLERTLEIAAGPLILTIIASETAQTFHVVDHLSRWSPACHPQYAQWASRSFPLDDAERAMLARHAQLRRKRGWRSGFEQAFYVEADLDAAVARAVEEKLLTADEANAERAILAHFAPRLAPILADHEASIAELEQRVKAEAPRLGELAEKVVRFAEVRGRQPITIFPIPDPTPRGAGGGAFDGARFVLELAAGSDAIPLVLHEALHAILVQRRETIAVAASKCAQSVDETTIERAMAYALAPGLLHAGDPHDDPLAAAVAATRTTKRALRDPTVRFQRLGLELRPLLVESFDEGATLGAFLPRACDAWKRIARE
jgi:hypothetical protein